MTYGRRQRDSAGRTFTGSRATSTRKNGATRPWSMSLRQATASRLPFLRPLGLTKNRPPRQPVAGRDLDWRRALGAHELAIKPPHQIDRFLVADRRFVGHVSLAEVYFAGALCASCIYYLHNSKQPAAQLPHDVSEW